MRKKYLSNIILIASIIGLIISSYLTYIHYSDDEIICVMNENNCNNVLKGEYSSLFFNLPNTIVGMIGFSMFFALSLMKNYKEILILSSIAVAFVLYLAYLVFFVINSFCIWCFSVWILILIIFACSLLKNK